MKLKRVFYFCPLYIYVLYDPRSPEHYRYVGWTVNLHRRMLKHMLAANLIAPIHKNNWINSLLSQGVMPIMKEIYCWEDPVFCWKEMERSYIAKYREEGHDLTNSRGGGYGTSGPICTGYKRTEESKQRSREAQLHPDVIAKKSACMIEYYASMSDEERQERFNTSIHSPVARAKAKVTILKSLNTPEYKSANSEFHKTRYASMSDERKYDILSRGIHSPISRERAIVALKENGATPEFKKKMSDIVSERFSDRAVHFNCGQRIMSTNTSGATGVMPYRDKWRAQICIDGKNIRAVNANGKKYFDTFEEAVLKRKELEKRFYPDLAA